MKAITVDEGSQDAIEPSEAPQAEVVFRRLVTLIPGWPSGRAGPPKDASVGVCPSLIAALDPALGQETLDVTQRQRVTDVHHHDQTDHFLRAVEISKRAAYRT